MKRFLLALIMTFLALMSVRSWAFSVEFPNMAFASYHFDVTAHARAEDQIEQTTEKRIAEKRRMLENIRGSFGFSLAQEPQKNPFDREIACNIAITDLNHLNSRNQDEDEYDSSSEQNNVMQKVLMALSELNSLLKQAGIQKTVKIENDQQEDLTDDAVDYYQARLTERDCERKHELVQVALIAQKQKRMKKKEKKRKKRAKRQQLVQQQPIYLQQPAPQIHFQQSPFQQSPMMPMMPPLSYGYGPTVQPMMMAPHPSHNFYQPAVNTATLDQVSELVDEKLAAQDVDHRQMSNLIDEKLAAYSHRIERRASGKKDNELMINLGISEVGELAANEKVPFVKKEKEICKILNQVVSHKGMGELITQQVQNLLDHEIKIVGCLLANRPAVEIEGVVGEKDALFEQCFSCAQQLYNVVLDVATDNNNLKNRLSTYANHKNQKLKQSTILRDALSKKERRIFLQSVKATLERYHDYITARYIKLSSR